LNISKQLVVSAHTINLGHSFDWKKIKILDTKLFYYKRIISEMLHIKEINGINCNKDTELLDGSYFSILKELTNTRL